MSLQAAISPVLSRIKTLLDRLTQERADAMDNLASLDADVSTRASSTDMGTMLTRLTDPRAANLDLIPNLESFGPPGPGFSWPQDPSPTEYSYLTGMTRAGAYLDLPINQPTELLNLVGPGVISFCTPYITTNNTYATFNLVVDGVDVGVSPRYYCRATTDRVVPIIGYCGGASGAQIAQQNVTFRQSLQLYVTCEDPDTNWYAFYRYYPIQT